MKVAATVTVALGLALAALGARFILCQPEAQAMPAPSDALHWHLQQVKPVME